jgi:hypothetical protein
MRMTDMKGTGNDSSSITIFSSPAISNGVVIIPARLARMGITGNPWKGKRASEMIEAAGISFSQK